MSRAREQLRHNVRFHLEIRKQAYPSNAERYFAIVPIKGGQCLEGVNNCGAMSGFTSRFANKRILVVLGALVHLGLDAWCPRTPERSFAGQR